MGVAKILGLKNYPENDPFTGLLRVSKVRFFENF